MTPHPPLIDPHYDYALQAGWRDRQYANGHALEGHCAGAHAGKINENCPACKELQRKTKEGKA